MRTFAPFGGHDAASMANLERKRDECAPKENREERARNTNAGQGTLKRGKVETCPSAAAKESMMTVAALQQCAMRRQ